MIGKQRAREGFQILDMTTLVSAKNDIGDEHHVVRGTRLRYDEGFGDSGMLAQDSLDLAAFHAVTPNLELLVSASHEFDDTIRQKASQVARIVHPPVAVGGIGPEPGSREFR